MFQNLSTICEILVVQAHDEASRCGAGRSPTCVYVGLKGKLAQFLETLAGDTSLMHDKHTLDLVKAQVVEMKLRTCAMKATLHATQCLVTWMAK